jgi:site-specific DNA-adenine methylase
MANPRIGTDAMKDLMLLWGELVNDTFVEPSFITKEQYEDLMQSNVHSALRAYAGFFWSFSGMFHKGYSQEYFQRSHSFAKMRRRSALLRGATLCGADYREVGSRGFLIYADPPYRDTTTYRGVSPFNHDEFYSWCELKRAAGNTLIISEYDMPSPFKMIAEFPATTTLGVSKRTKAKPERLYTL